jgi:hypothetical protein
MRPALRRARHAVAALMGVLLLQLTLVGAGVACAAAVNGGADSRIAASGGSITSQGDDGHEHNAGHDPADATTPGDGSGSHHGQTNSDGGTHCPAPMGCTTVGVVDVAVTLPSATVRVAKGIVPTNATTPESVGGAPEPPPPRA